MTAISPPASTPLTVVVPTRDRPHLLDAALDAITRAVRPGDQIVVVDSASGDAAAVRRLAESARARVVRCDAPGASRARNAGAAVADTPVVAFTDDDCRPHPGWAQAIADAFERDDQLAFVTGMVLPDRERGVVLSVATGQQRRLVTEMADLRGAGHGANLAVRLVGFQEVNGFDELLGAGGRFLGSEDQDLIWRLLRAGWRGLYEPEAVVVHLQWRSPRQALLTQFGYGVGSGALGVKARRLDRRAGTRYLRRALWDDGFASAARNLRRRQRAGVAADLTRVAGVVAGSLRLWRVRVTDGRYVG